MDRIIAIFAMAAIATFSLQEPAVAQSWPTRPLTLVVPFAAGGPSDVAARIIAQRMSELLSQQWSQSLYKKPPTIHSPTFLR
jgi:tripartite-type tricarboxylate transporter receptor subunit TctC